MLLHPTLLRSSGRALLTRTLLSPRFPTISTYLPTLTRAYAKPRKPNTRSKPLLSKPAGGAPATTYTLPPHLNPQAAPAPTSYTLDAPPPERKHTFLTLEEQLALLRAPKLLYSCENGPFRAVCVMFVLGSLYYIAYTAEMTFGGTFVADGKFAPFLKGGNTLGLACMSMFTLVMMFYPSRLILRVRSLPDPNRRNSVLLELTKRCWLLPKSETIVVRPSEMTLLEPLKYEVPSAEIIYSFNPVTRFFQRLLSRQIFTIRWLRELLSTRKFVQVKVKGWMYPLTINKHGWQWERNGLERIIPMKARKKWE